MPRASTSPLRIGLLGCGRIALGAHLPLLAGLPDVELAGVAEIDPAQRAACAATLSGPAVVGDYRELLDRGGLDAAVICLSTQLHAEAAIACFERGLHVYLEKPLAISVAAGEAVIGAWKSAGTLGAIGFNFRFHPLVLRLREALRNGELGDPIGAQTVFSGAQRTLPEWKLLRSTGGGALLDLASHHVDLMRFLFGSEIVEVGAMLRSVASEEDTAVVELRLEQGALVTLLVSLAAIDQDRLAIYGSRGALVFDRYRSTRLAFVPAVRDPDARARLRTAGRAVAGAPRRLRDLLLPPREPSFGLALAAFARAARGGEWPGADLDDGFRSLAVVDAAERAAAGGGRVAPVPVPGRALAPQLGPGPGPGPGARPGPGPRTGSSVRS